MLIPALALPALVLAQTAPGEPPRSLRLSISAFGGYDTDLTGTAPNNETAASAPYVGARASLAYQVRTEKIGFSAFGGADSRRYRTDDPFTAGSYDGGTVFTADLTSRLKVGASAAGAYSPRFVFSLLPVAGEIAPDVAPPPLDYGISSQRMVSYAVASNATLRVSRRSTLYATVSGGAQDFLDDNYDTNSRSYGGRYSYSVTRYTSLRVGYLSQNTDYLSFGTAPQYTFAQRLFDVGVNYSRPLSISRRTTVSFGTGTSAIDDGRDTFYAITGNATLVHQIGRAWDTSVAYARGLTVIAGFAEPFFADSVNATLKGRFTNRITMLTSAGFSNGAVGLGARSNNYNSLQASSRLEMAFDRGRMGVYGNYFFYGYKFGEIPLSVAAIPRRMNRHGVRAGLVFRFPLLHERMPRVTR